MGSFQRRRTFRMREGRSSQGLSRGQEVSSFGFVKEIDGGGAMRHREICWGEMQRTFAA